MNIDEYAVEARRTAVYAGRGTALGLAYAVLGLVGEYTEFLADPCDEERGDVAWMLIAVADEIHMEPSELADGSISDVLMAIGQVCELTKKTFGSGAYSPAWPNLGDRQIAVEQHLADIWVSLNLTPEVLEENIAKLRARQAAGTLLRR